MSTDTSKASLDEYLDQRRKLREDAEGILQMQDLLCQKITSLIGELPAPLVFDLSKELYEFKMKADEINKTATDIQQQLQDLIDDNKEDLKKRLIRLSSDLEARPTDNYQEAIEELKKDVDQLQSQFEEVNRLSRERLVVDDKPVEPRSYLTCAIPAPIEVIQTRLNEFNTLSHLLVRQVSPSIVDINFDELELTEESQDDQDKVIELSSSSSAPRINQKIHLSNNIVRWIRGPFRIVVEGTLHMVDLCAQGTRINDTVFQAVQQGFTRQHPPANELFKPPFTEITSEWENVGLNSDQGYSSPSVWMKDPQGRRYLMKTQDHALGAVNEWLAYALGRVLGLPVNEVQIAVHDENLVTLHADIAKEDEQTMTFMDLPKKVQKRVITDPLLASMDLFDHIIQNVDRNPRNILITFPKSASIDDENVKLKVHFIDHTPCFGMGKWNGISVVASKFHSHHLAVVKFDPIGQAKKFERYLNKLPVKDRVLIRKTLNRFTSITDEQIDQWITQIQALLSPSQYLRIHSVLYRQRDVARRYAVQWGIEPRRSHVQATTDSETAHF